MNTNVGLGLPVAVNRHHPHPLSLLPPLPASPRPSQTPKIRFGHKRCSGNGTCACEPGYAGRFCEEAVCDQGCVHGKCLRPGYCTCEDGYKGRSCEEPVCAKACAHGECPRAFVSGAERRWNICRCNYYSYMSLYW